MLQRLRHRAQGQEGFTLIELLVVILIIGILAAVAIPTFLSQTNKAKDSNAQAVLSTVQTTEATYQTSNGSYLTGLSSSNTTSANNGLIAIEPTLSGPWGTYTMAVTTPASASGLGAVDAAAAGVSNGFTVLANGQNSVKYWLTYDAGSGTVYKDCTPASTGGCNASSRW